MRPRRFAIFLLACLWVVADSANAFYQFEDSDIAIDARGFARLIGWVSDNPQIDFIYENDNDYGMQGIGRLMLDAEKGERVAFELNVFEQYNSVSSTFDIDGQTRTDVERSSALEWWQIDGEKTSAILAVDRFNIRLSFDRVDMTIGRQAVNLATTYYFTPNDFFAPFSAQTFYRVYKSGVDALRTEIRLGEFTQVTLLGVMGYKHDSGSQSGWGGRADWDRASAIARIATVFLNFEWGVIIGNVRGSDVVGGSIQGELPLKLGLRVEGHYLNPDKEGEAGAREISAEVDRRWSNTLTLRLAYFHHGAGADTAGDYDLAGSDSYIARSYAAMGVSFEFTPILYGEVLLLGNLVDDSYLISFYAVYSLSDEAELSAGLSIPDGTDPTVTSAASEYGAQPVIFNFEFRTFF